MSVLAYAKSRRAAFATVSDTRSRAASTLMALSRRGTWPWLELRPPLACGRGRRPLARPRRRRGLRLGALERLLPGRSRGGGTRAATRRPRRGTSVYFPRPGRLAARAHLI